MKPTKRPNVGGPAHKAVGYRKAAGEATAALNEAYLLPVLAAKVRARATSSATAVLTRMLEGMLADEARWGDTPVFGRLTAEGEGTG